jgi:hypothetical protein
MKKMVLGLVVLASLISVNAVAHSGGTDTNGCHMDHKTGSWHCH